VSPARTVTPSSSGIAIGAAGGARGGVRGAVRGFDVDAVVVLRGATG
jgi:hypothetical protein